MSHHAVAPSSVSPKSKGEKSVQEGRTALEKHVAFFDRNEDGVVYPWETYQGFRALGTGRLTSAFVAIFINIGLSKKTRPGKGFSPLFPIEVKNSRFGIHGSDTDVYDKDGRFVESKFEEIFKKHAHTHKDGSKEIKQLLETNREPNDFIGWFVRCFYLASKEIKQLLETNREPNDFIGWLAAFLEWKILHDLAKDKNGLLTKDTVRGVYDGSLFLQLEKQRSSSSSRGKKNKLP